MSPSPFVVEWIERLARNGGGGRALDLAMGRGRHAVAAARAGFRTFGVDLNVDAARDAVVTGQAAGLRIHAWCADLTQHPLPADRFDLVVVVRYLQRDLFPALQRSAARGGVVLYETFTTAQLAFGTGPRSPDHLLEPGELRERFDTAMWDVLAYEESRQGEAVARLAARRRV